MSDEPKALIEEANAFRDIAYSRAGQWIIANAHDLGGLEDGTITLIRKLRDDRMKRIEAAVAEAD